MISLGQALVKSFEIIWALPHSYIGLISGSAELEFDPDGDEKDFSMVLTGTGIYSRRKIVVK